MSWRNLAYGSQAAAEAAPTVAPTQQAPPSETVIPQVDASSVPKNDGAKVYKILEYLRMVPMHQPVSIRDIFQHTGIDLVTDEQVDQRLKNNPKVRVDGDSYAYQAKYNIKNRDQLVKILDRSPEGMPIEDLIDCYVGVESDLQELTHSGDIICVKNAEKGAEVFYPRGMQFLVEAPGVATIEPGCYYARSSVDMTQDFRRGDAIKIGNYWFRVSAAVKTSNTARPTQFAGMASKSVSSTRDPNVSKKIRYMLKFDQHYIPLDGPYPDAKGREITTARWDALPTSGPKMRVMKHGCTNDIRQLWKDTLREWPADRLEFERKLMQAGLTTQDKLDANRLQIKRRLKDSKKKSRVRKQREIKLSNQHLIGTELGELLSKGGDEPFTLGAVQFEKQQ